MTKKRTRRAAGSAALPSRPRRWNTAVAVAAYRVCGSTQAEAAKAAGVSVRTVREWERASWWPDALREASDTWLHELTAYARGALLRAVRAGNPEYAWRIIERTVPELRPPRANGTIGTFDYDALDDAALVRIAAGEDPAIVLADRRKR